MQNTKFNIMERYLILLDKFVDKIIESGVSEQQLIERSYVFCAGYYIKYQQEIERLTFSNKDVVLTFLLFSYYNYINELDNNLIDKVRMRRTCSLLINFIVDNGSQTEKFMCRKRRSTNLIH